MIVDDSEVDILILRKCIEMCSVPSDIISRQSANEALEYLLAATADLMPDVLFLDIKMPEMDGFEFLDRLFSTLQYNPRMKIVILTSSTAREDISRAKEYVKRGVADYIEKPLTNNLDHLRKILRAD
jgi:CheY-like chemotaxis protein